MDRLEEIINKAIDDAVLLGLKYSNEEWQAKYDTLHASREKLVKALIMMETRLLVHGTWDEGCYYYAGTAAPELEEPLNLIRQVLAEAQKINK